MEKIAKDLHKIAVPQQMTKVAVYDGPQEDEKRAAAYGRARRAHAEMLDRVGMTQSDQPDAHGGESSETEPSS